jgi:hypothetical protein
MLPSRAVDVPGAEPLEDPLLSEGNPSGNKKPAGRGRIQTKTFPPVASVLEATG